MSVKRSVFIVVAAAASVCFAETTYDLANGNVSVPANTVATIMQSNSSTPVARKITIGNNAVVTLKGINIIQNGQGNPILCNGNATVILADGTVNTLDKTTTRYDSIPFHIYGSSGTTVVIKGEAAGTGKLIAKAPDYHVPGIGGQHGGNICVEGGVIVATGSESASGIGAGEGGTGIGNITIKGGTITTTGNYAGIGAGYGTSCGNITISGGTVNASGYWRAGIAGANVTISGGIVNAKSTGSHGPGGISASGSVSITEGITKVVANVYVGNPIKGANINISPVLLDVVTNNGLTRTLTCPTYTITWENEDGTILDVTADVRHGVVPMYGGATPTKESTGRYAYEFAGWSPTVVAATADTTYTATYNVILLNPEDPVISPESGTTFDSSLTVSISCSTEGANIYYTTNGVDPTVDSTAYRRFRIYGKTTVKAIAEKDGLLSEVATAEYALGRCGDPVISLSDGMEFAHSNQVVSIRRRGRDREGVLRYTLDGSDPTSESPVYEGPFVINDSIEVKAKVFSDLYFDSAIVTSSLVRVWENVATPVIDAPESFTGSKAKVVISSATEGATIYYTLDGSVPDTTSAVYTGPIYVTDSCTVKAYAVMPDYLNSAVVAQGVEKVWVIGDALGKPDHVFTTDEDGGAGWIKVDDATAPNGEAMRSGAITHGQSSVLATTVVGSGTLTFSWRTSCEEDALQEWDHVELSVDDTVVQKLDGITAWTNETVRIEGDGEHIVEWRYVKDYAESVGEDAAWVAGYGWASDYTETKTTDVPVPYTWLRHHDPEIIDEYDAYEAAASAMAANGRNRVWECYAINLNPTLATSNFRITAFPMKEDGTPDLANIVFEPAQAQWNVPGARAILKGAAELAGPWVEIPANDGGGTASSQGGEPVPRFFKMEVILP